MKNKIMSGVALGFAIIGLAITFYCICAENESSYLLSLSLLCITIGNLVNVWIRKKQEEKNSKKKCIDKDI